MMNQGGVTDTITTLDPKISLEHHAVDPSHAQTPSYYVPPAATVSTSGATNLEYSSYASYPNSDPNGYPNTNYSSYYSNYQQQPNQSYPQQQQPIQSYPQQQQTNQSYPQQLANQSQSQSQSQSQTYGQPSVAYQTTGAPHQPISSLGSYAGPTNYSTTYYNPGDYQTTGGYPNYSQNQNHNQNQTNAWNQGSYANYSHQYPNYSAESNGAYNAQNAPAVSQYQQPDYNKQWADYYSQTEVTCAPGTENVSSIPAVSSSYSDPNSHQNTASWRPESGLSELPSVQPSAPINNVHEGYWKQGGQTQTYQNYHINPMQPNYQKPLDLNPNPVISQNQQTPEIPQFQNVQSSSYQPSLPPPPPLPLPPQMGPPFDSGHVQIPKNSRISPNLPKINNPAIGISKPAYVSVSIPKADNNASSHSHVAADSSLKPGALPKSLRGYVERALGRCKDDKQMAACQAILKEVITKASTDGTLCTRDWDIEPLFSVPNSDVINTDSSTTPSSLVKTVRRTKSRWEPLPEEKQTPFTPNNERDNKQFSTGKPETKENKFNNLKFYLSNKKETNNRPAKRQHIVDNRIGINNNINNGESSSDSDKEQNLTPYYASAITLANTPEERKRREFRSKRFEKNHGNRSAPNVSKSKNVGNLRGILGNSSSLDDGVTATASRAVEDIDWDSLTVKGTCQEIEKRYLRLTSAPDPATVRPEEVLEKALLLVKNSQKNYLYKCDQLKSIRQDLTVQRIRNELTAKVYETHARLAIEVADLSEYNQCQSQLQNLYGDGIKGCHMEFSAYNLLCVILHSNNNRDLLSAMSRLSIESRKDEGVKHALAVRAAVTSGNYVLFFRLYNNAPNLNTCLMDLYVEKMRYAAVKCMTRSYRPTLPVSYVAQILGFQPLDQNQKDPTKLEECTEWLKAHGACLTMDDNSGEMMLDAKASMASLFMPEPDDAVSHGDASLAVNDFLTRSLS